MKPVPRAVTLPSMRSLPARLRSLDPARADALLAVGFLVEVAVELAAFFPDGRPHLAIAIGLELVTAAALAIRRRAPVVAATLGMAALTAVTALSIEYGNHLVSIYFADLFLIYSAGRHLDDRRALFVGVLASSMQLVQQAVDPAADSLTVANTVTSIAFVAWAPLLIGRFMRHRARLHATLVDKARRLERERAVRADEAALQERGRVAGELHDVVAHALSAMVVQAGAARRLTEREPARAAEAFQAVEQTGREALTEIRRLLGVLRREDEELALAPQPSLRHVGSLVGRVRAAGLPVDLTVEGDARELPAGVDLTAYRVVQSALKAAIEQGGAGHADVRLRYAGDQVLLEVGDDGPSADRPLPGVPERVALYGGQLRSVPRHGGGHLVRARLPLEATA
jgi:signal transduction histidine kinase